MGKFTGFLSVVYFAAAVVLVPRMVYDLWAIVFASPVWKQVALSEIPEIVTWFVVGIAVIVGLSSRCESVLAAKVRSVAPTGFKPSVELKGAYLTEYLGMCPREHYVVIVDLKRNIARREPMSFIQGWTLEEDGSNTRIVIRFNDFTLSSIKFDIAHQRRNDIIAKLNHAMQF